MKRLFFLVTMAFMCCITLFAQAEFTMTSAQRKQAIKEREAIVKQTAKSIEAKCVKEAKAQAKVLTKEGWKPAVGAVSIEKQLNDLLLKQYEMDGNFPKYIIGKSSAVSGSYATARKSAETRARAEIASNIAAEVASLAEDANNNSEMSAKDVETLTKYVETTKQLVQQSLGRTQILLEIYREKEDKTEMQIAICSDGSRSKDAVRKAFENESAELKAKLEKVLNK